MGLLIAVCVAQVGSLFSADAWNNITFTAGEVKEPRRNLPLSLALGTGLVITLYLLANLAYLCVLPLDRIQHAADDRVGTAAMQVMFGGAAATIMAGAIMISTFGCSNGLILAGTPSILCDGPRPALFQSDGSPQFPARPFHGPPFAGGLDLFARSPAHAAARSGHERAGFGCVGYGTIWQPVWDVARLRRVRGPYFLCSDDRRTVCAPTDAPQRQRPYRAFGYPVLPALYLIAASVILVVLALYRTQTSWPGLHCVLGVPIYLFWRRSAARGV